VWIKYRKNGRLVKGLAHYTVRSKETCLLGLKNACPDKGGLHKANDVIHAVRGLHS
jgi:hypothetical protein